MKNTKRARRSGHRAGHQEASAKITAALATLPYPISKQQAAEALETWPIRIGRDLEVSAGRILDALPEIGFEDPGEATRAVDKHWSEITDRLLG